MDIFDKFQLIMLALFYSVLVGRALRMIFRGINPLVLGLGKKGIRGVLELSFLCVLTVWTIEIISHASRAGFHIFPPACKGLLFDVVLLKGVGSILIIGGFVLFILSLISFGNSWRIGIDKRNPGNLVTTGIFSMTRNPIFIFLDIYFIGTWLIYPTVFFGIVAVLTVGGAHWQILQEEKFLAAKYGKEYEEYTRKTRRYV